jgi:hypothetical protein
MKARIERAPRPEEGVGPCRRCERPVATSVSVCRACGYDASEQHNECGQFVWGVAGAFLALSVVGLPFAVPCLWKAVRHHQALTNGVVDDERAARPRFVATVEASGLSERDATGGTCR